MRFARTVRTIALVGALLALASPALAQEEGEQLTQLDRWWNAVWALGLFAGLLLVLRRLAWKPLLRVIQDRESSIREALREADRRQAESQELLTEYRSQLDGAQEEMARLMARTAREAEAARQRIVSQAEQTAATTTRQARQEIELARRQALNEIYRTTTELAAGMAGKILQREVNPEDHRRLVADSIEGIRKQP